MRERAHCLCLFKSERKAYSIDHELVAALYLYRSCVMYLDFIFIRIEYSLILIWNYQFAMFQKCYNLFVVVSLGTGDSPIQCRTTLDCSGNFTFMSARDCCVGNPDGLSFTVPGVETCQVCIGMSISPKWFEVVSSQGNNLKLYCRSKC